VRSDHLLGGWAATGKSLARLRLLQQSVAAVIGGEVFGLGELGVQQRVVPIEFFQLRYEFWGHFLLEVPAACFEGAVQSSLSGLALQQFVKGFLALIGVVLDQFLHGVPEASR
jgi:hypothetical protein